MEWIEANDRLLALMGAVSLLLFVLSLMAVPVIIACMPADYFIRLKRGPRSMNPLRHFLHLLKNLSGILLVLAGLAMLLLPGQGILTMVIGLSLADFPGKHRLQLKLVRIPRVHRSIDWIRRRFNRPPILLPD